MRAAISHTSPDHQCIIGLGHRLQIIDIANIDDRVQPLEHLGHPKPDIRAPGQNGGIGMGNQKGGQFIRRTRCEITPCRMFKRKRTFTLDHRSQFSGNIGSAFLFGTVIGSNTTGLARGLDNRAIARATAQIARQRIIDCTAIILATIQPQLIQAHDKARRTKTAL